MLFYYKSTSFFFFVGIVLCNGDFAKETNYNTSNYMKLRSSSLTNCEKAALLLESVSSKRSISYREHFKLPGM